ncbi:hypothetical protein HAX54_045054 [Datura stramonium]|uniref:Uncharacterized protein n=1 Tax=Datura stramonium TaxID=4076 RepID=A0ABS8SQB7_DATST|nr:hypothetical protein [Datura stramonium]
MTSSAVASFDAVNAPENTVAVYRGMPSYTAASFGAPESMMAAHRGMSSFAVDSTRAQNAPQNMVAATPVPAQLPPFAQHWWWSQQLISPPARSKLSPNAPTFMPKGSGIVSASSPSLNGQQVENFSFRDKELLDVLVVSTVTQNSSRPSCHGDFWAPNSKGLPGKVLPNCSTVKAT